MLSQVNISQVVDLGFIALVSFVCIKTIFGSSSDSMFRRAEAVRRDLRELESALRELIGEAAAASGNLDKSLNRRKAELEQLLSRLEEKSATGELDPSAYEQQQPAARVRPIPAGRTSTAAAAPIDTPDELPNESWTMGLGQNRDSRRFQAQDPEATETIAQNLRDLIETSQDSVTISSEFENFARRQQRSQKAGAAAVQPAKLNNSPAKAAVKPAAASVLAKKLEQIKIEQQSEYIPNFIEPGAFRVAKRLLQAGQEIHVVARKVELPLADVRVIERLVRGAWEETDGAPADAGDRAAG